MELITAFPARNYVTGGPQAPEVESTELSYEDAAEAGPPLDWRRLFRTRDKAFGSADREPSLRAFRMIAQNLSSLIAAPAIGRRFGCAHSATVRTTIRSCTLVCCVCGSCYLPVLRPAGNGASRCILYALLRSLAAEIAGHPSTSLEMASHRIRV